LLTLIKRKLGPEYIKKGFNKKYIRKTLKYSFYDILKDFLFAPNNYIESLNMLW